MTRVIPNNNPAHNVEELPSEFVAAITELQIEANRGWAPDNNALIDRRIVNCPTCKAPGMNSCWGYWLYTCGAEILADGETFKACQEEPSEERPHD